MTELTFLGADTGEIPCIDRYELIAEIASGGMAAVYLARVRGVGGFERFFAIKRLHPHLGKDEAFVNMFLDEARLVARIRHQHVVPVLEVGTGEHGYYLVMEYIEGVTLATLLSQSVRREVAFPPAVAVRIALDVLAGLHAAHELVDPDGHPVGLVHRDVSPQNVLIDINGVTRIADFGVAHATSRLGSTRAGQLKGKVAYMAPEQARGDLVTRRSDVFAAAIVLWESLCQRRLFMADNEAVTLNNLIFERIPPLREFQPSMPPLLEQVLARALTREPEARFATAMEFAEALEAACRPVRLVASTNEVKLFITATVGAEAKTRREQVRAHLTRIDGQRPEFTGPDASQRLQALSGSVASPPPGSSVSSAAMAVPTPPRNGGGGTPAGAYHPGVQAPPRGAGRWVIAGVALLTITTVAIVLVVTQWPTSEPIPIEGPATAVDSTVPMVTDLPPEPSAPAASTNDAHAEPETSAVGSADPELPVPKKPKWPKGPKRPPTTVDTAAPPATTPPKDTSGAPAAADDLKQNPYR